jgi:hypothetical protein
MPGKQGSSGVDLLERLIDQSIMRRLDPVLASRRIKRLWERRLLASVLLGTRAMEFTAGVPSGGLVGALRLVLPRILIAPVD